MVYVKFICYEFTCSIIHIRFSKNYIFFLIYLIKKILFLSYVKVKNVDNWVRWAIWQKSHHWWWGKDPNSVGSLYVDISRKHSVVTLVSIIDINIAIIKYYASKRMKHYYSWMLPLKVINQAMRHSKWSHAWLHVTYIYSHLHYRGYYIVFNSFYEFQCNIV